MTDRDEKGRFTPGRQAAPGPGRPSRASERAYLEAMISVVSLDDWKAITRRAVSEAKKGNGYARQWLSEYLIGKPPTIIDLRAADAKLLAELLKRFEAHGMTPSEAFEAMMQEFAVLESEVEGDEG